MDLTLERSSSVDSSGSRESFNSDDLNENEYFDFAPYDIYDESQILGKILVASKGDALPKDTKYLSKKDADVAVRFRINKDLTIEILKKVSKIKSSGNRQVIKPLIHSPSVSSLSSFNGNLTLDESFSASSTHENATQASSDPGQTPQVRDDEDSIMLNKDPVSPSPRETLNISRKTWLEKFDANFVQIVVDGLESTLREQVRNSISNKVKLIPIENKAVIRAVNHEIYRFMGGSQRPDASLCR